MDPYFRGERVTRSPLEAAMFRFALIFALVLVAAGTSHSAPCSSSPEAPQVGTTAAPLLVVPETAPTLRTLIVEPARPLTGRLPGALPT